MLASAVRDGTAESRSGLPTNKLYAFAVGEFGANLSWNMISGFILYYYSNVALLPVAAVGTLLLVTRILDAVIDPLIGVAVDKTRSRFGRARPWLLFGGPPFAALTVMTFTVPAWSEGSKLLYAYITFTLAGILYSALYVPYNAMVPLMTSSPVDKLRLGGLRSMAASAGSIVIYGLMMTLVGHLGGGNAQRGFTVTSGIMALGSVLAALIVFLSCRERSHDGPRTKTEPIGQGLRDMLRNPVWLVVSGFALAMFFRIGTLVSVTAYFAIETLGKPAAIGLLLSSLSVSLLIGGLLSKPYLARFGKRRGNIMALALAIVLTGCQALTVGNQWLFGCLYFISNITLGLQSATIFTMIPDAVDAQEARFGSRNEGLLSSTVSFAMKVGMAVGGSAIAYGLAALGYVPGHADAFVRHGIGLLYFGAPALCAALQIAIIFFYREERA